MPGTRPQQEDRKVDTVTWVDKTTNIPNYKKMKTYQHNNTNKPKNKKNICKVTTKKTKQENKTNNKNKQNIQSKYNMLPSKKTNNIYIIFTLYLKNKKKLTKTPN